ncbi:MAG: hypothetical protein HPY55_12510 [Firmicutes bacterium]|nr:hypothetical protein [Bacillota bacterium]
MKAKLLHPDVVAGLLAIVVSAVFINAAGRLPSFEVNLAGPEFFPRVSAGLLIVLALLQIAAKLRPLTEDGAEDGYRAGDENTTTVLLAVGLSAAYYYAMVVIGFMLSTFLYCVSLTLVTQEKRDLKRAAGNAVIVVAVVHVVFSYLLKASLPAGSLFR